MDVKKLRISFRADRLLSLEDILEKYPTVWSMVIFEGGFCVGWLCYTNITELARVIHDVGLHYIHMNFTDEWPVVDSETF